MLDQSGNRYRLHVHAIIKALAAALDIKRSQVELASGPTNRRKTFWISEPPADFASRVAKRASDSG